MKKFLIQSILLIFLTTILTACGFQLRGHQPLPPQLHVLYIESSNPYGDLTKQLQQTLRAIGIVLTKDATTAPVTLQILTETPGQQMTSQGSNGQLTTYVLTYNITYQLLDKTGRVIQAPQTVATSRSYSVNSNQVTGDMSVQSGLQQDMQRDVLNQLLNRLRSINTQKALASIPIEAEAPHATAP